MNHRSELRVPEEVYEARVKRLKRLLDLDAPRVILCNEAEIFLHSFKWSWRGWWHGWRWRNFPRWLMWATSAEWRQIVREAREEEEFTESL